MLIFLTWLRHVCLAHHHKWVTAAHLIEFGLLTGEGESESQWKFLVFDAQLVQETGQALNDVVKKLQMRGAFL